MTSPDDTIVALATPPGQGGIGVVRVSGPAAHPIAREILGQLPPLRHARYGPFLDEAGDALDTGIALVFGSPDSFTGEDVLELQGHGGPVVLDLLIKRALRLGARLAEPGEFTQRAFLNDKYDLAQAEAVADLIASGSVSAARAAMRSLAGAFSQRVHELSESVTELRTWVEAAIDFPEEEIDFLAEPELATRVEQVERQFDALTETTKQGCMLREGMVVVLAGPPNAGKSSLMNRLAGYDAAIVTDVPGTTRDVLREYIDIDGMPLKIIDTAGLRVGGDTIEREGMRRTRAEIENADRVLFVIDETNSKGRREMLDEALPEGVPVTVVHNKIDLTGEPPRSDDSNAWLSAKTGIGIELLRSHLADARGYHPQTGALIARRRHLDALGRARERVEKGQAQLRAGAGELMAEELRLAQQALGEITGQVTSDDLLGRIFASFCIGK